MHRPHSITWTTHTEESTTLLEATRLQEALLYTALHYTYMCNIVTEFYLYSIVYIYLINSRLDVTTSVRHHFRTPYKLYQKPPAHDITIRLDSALLNSGWPVDQHGHCGSVLSIVVS